MSTGRDGVWLTDAMFLGHPGAIAVGVIEDRLGLIVVDPGPTTCLDVLRAALARRGHTLDEVRAILVTHVHLDHSGATGTIVREHPSVRVFVHERGAPHMVDPSRLVASAQRIYRDRMDRLWGRVEPVDASLVTPLVGGERLDLVGRPVRVAYTPGHAVHHVSYLDETSGVAFTGDVGGLALAGTSLAVPPTPPPDIDLEQWRDSLQQLHAWRPVALMIAHFGFVEAPADHLDDLERRLGRYADLVRQSLDVVGPDQNRIAFFRAGVMDDLHRVLPAGVADEVARGYMIDESWHGLARYWRKRAPRGHGADNGSVDLPDQHD